MSTDGKYLKATDVKDRIRTWDITKAHLIQFPVKWDDIKQRMVPDIPQDIEWKSGHVPKHLHDCTMDEANNYAAYNTRGSGLSIEKNYELRSLTETGTSDFPVKIDLPRSAIILFKRPTLESYLYQQIFKRNINDLEQLHCSYELVKDYRIEDFPRRNLKRLILNRIQHLTQLQKSQTKL
jgi:hypothetical protein